MNERLYNGFGYEGIKCFEPPTQHVNLLSAFYNKISSAKGQAMLQVNIAVCTVNQIVLLSQSRLTDLTLVDHNSVIKFAERRIAPKFNGDYTKVEFIGIK
jgi:hypothetical protein